MMNSGWAPAPFDYLRLSVTTRCQLSCTYCRPEHPGPAESSLPAESLVSLCETFCAVAPIRKIRLSGGEPLLRPDLLDLVAALAKLPTKPEITLTTNGVLLEDMAAGLAAAGLSRLNVHVDTADAAAYAGSTAVPALSRVLRGLLAACAAGFRGTKINAVLTSALDALEVRRLLVLAADNDAVLRFIELMPLGLGGRGYESLFLSADLALRRISDAADLAPEEPDTATLGSPHPRFLAALQDGRRVTVEMIAPMSRPFCSGCRRVRLTCDGRLLPCLLSPVRLSLLGEDGSLPAAPALTRLLHRCASLKRRAGMCLPERMWAIGG
jgi:cyclic pyranopterin phosphate synthase